MLKNSFVVIELTITVLLRNRFEYVTKKASWEGEGEIQDTGDKKKVKGGDKKEGIKDLEGSIKEEGSA